MTYQREANTRLKIAVVGVGSHCYRNILPALTYLPVDLTALCDVNEDLVRATAKQYGSCSYYTSTKEMYEREQLDAVLLAVSPFKHPELAIEAFQAGVHVWMEKPAAVRTSEVERMLEQRGDRQAMVGYKKMFMPSTDKVLEVLNSSQFDALNSMLAIYPMAMPANGREVLEQRQFQNWLGNGCHPLSLMLAAGGAVSAVTTHVGSKGHGTVLLDFANGITGNFHLASGPHPIESYHFYGGHWHLEIDNSLKVTLQRGIPFKYGYTTSYIPEGIESGAIVWEPQNCLATLENKALFTQGVYGELRYFCDCLLENRTVERGSLEFTLGLMKVYEAALISEGKTIYLD
ncbi:Gfo/Idh/MocA family protein [Paenibacillus cremeus]|uniref:Gfo/Idh/MocA family oxidoreductase n=1 Tax=Paenibacillus cremeus TaxID=2163881 RepID=A0A559KEA0_9BACL|nr:Gfo/Idh/MocA family oxidoreductase [Paenibacillus cremeus]TVY10444.1 Gfo/Idh/MocA family oxidoreductase [Paenibacillus cremeus]